MHLLIIFIKKKLTKAPDIMPKSYNIKQDLLKKIVIKWLKFNKFLNFIIKQ